MSLARSLTQTFAPLVDVVFPPRCPLCGGGIAAQSGLCGECWSELSIPGSPSCASCQRPFETGDKGLVARCGACLAHPPLHDGMTSATLYNDASRKLVLNFKHGRKIALAPMLARLMAARLPVLDGEWIAMPVPLHRFRLWHRGFNQSALLAKELARIKGLELSVDSLIRRKRTPSLGGLGRAERARVLAGAITVKSSQRGRVAGAQILLVDDVLTSGATTNACVAALQQAGAAKVRIVCFSRVSHERE